MMGMVSSGVRSVFWRRQVSLVSIEKKLLFGTKKEAF